MSLEELRALAKHRLSSWVCPRFGCSRRNNSVVRTCPCGQPRTDSGDLLALGLLKLLPFVEHADDCDMRLYGADCDCGLDAALATLEQP